MVSPKRSVPRSVVPILEALELEQSRLVTRELLEQLVVETDAEISAVAAARLLRERGWLLPLRTGGAWEFAPASRAGAIGGGDEFIELRARLATRPLEVAIAAESSAWLHGLASRAPDPQVIGLPAGLRIPGSLDRFRVVRWSPALDLDVIDGLPVWPVSTLLAFMGSRPNRFRDWPNVSEWLADAAVLVSVEALSRELTGQPRSGWARTSYLLFRGGAAAEATNLMALAPPGKGTFHLGPRNRTSHYERRFDVADHIFQRSWSIKAPR